MSWNPPRAAASVTRGLLKARTAQSQNSLSKSSPPTKGPKPNLRFYARDPGQWPMCPSLVRTRTELHPCPTRGIPTMVGTQGFLNRRQASTSSFPTPTSGTLMQCQRHLNPLQTSLINLGEEHPLVRFKSSLGNCVLKQESQTN